MRFPSINAASCLINTLLPTRFFLFYAHVILPFPITHFFHRDDGVIKLGKANFQGD